MLSRDQAPTDAQTRRVSADLSGGHTRHEAHTNCAPASLGGDQPPRATHIAFVAASDLAQAVHATTPGSRSPAPKLNGGQKTVDARKKTASASVNGDHPTHDVQRSSVPADALLKLYADLVEDLMAMRVATDNRKRSLIQVKELGGSPEEKRLAEMVKALKKIEDAAIRDLERQMTAHPLGAFAEQNLAVGHKSLARLLGAIGDPCSYVRHKDNDCEDRPCKNPEHYEQVERTVSKLWAYCGYKPGQGKYKGMEHNYNRKAKTLCYLIAESCMKNRKSPYRPVYEAARAKYEERDLPDWRKNSMALRVVAKEILKDLWKFRRGHGTSATRPCLAPPEELGRGHLGNEAHEALASAESLEAA